MSDTFTNVAKRDTSQGSESLGRQVLMKDAGSNNTWIIALDAFDAFDTPSLVIRLVDSIGARVDSVPEIYMDLGEIASLDLTAPVTLKFRELRWKDASTCVTYRAAFLMSAPEAVV